MAWHVILLPEASAAIGRFGLPRSGLVSLLTAIHVELALRVDQYRGNRNPADPLQFIFPVRLIGNGRGYRVQVYVNDSTAAERLFVEAVTCESTPEAG